MADDGKRLHIRPNPDRPARTRIIPKPRLHIRVDKATKPGKKPEMGKILEYTCAYCRGPIDAGDAFYECDSCPAILHTICWERRGGCPSLGCENNPTTPPVRF